jgi:hypothetical protein
MENYPTKGNSKEAKTDHRMKSSEKILYSSDTIISEKKYSGYDAFVCVPMSICKKPVISWKHLAKTPKNMFKDEHNIALVTGASNKITVIDIDVPKPSKDEKDGMKKYEEMIERYNNSVDLQTPTCITQSKGLHLYFMYDQDIKTTTGVNGYSIDIRNDNALIIAPPSVGTRGAYVWKNNQSLLNTKLQEIPQWLKEWILASYVKKEPIAKKKENKNNYETIKDSVFIYEKEHIIDLCNKLPKKYLDNYADWFIVTSCLKSEGLKDIWTRWSMKSKKYDSHKNDEYWESLEPKLDIYYLIILAKKEKIEVDDNIVKKTRKINFLTRHVDTIINEKFVDQKHLSNDVRTQIVKSNCGTGKTTLAAKHIESLAQGNGYKILSLTVRVSLAYQQVKNFKDNKIIMSIYKDLDEETLNKQDKLIIQIDSITKLCVKKWFNTIIYLDEISSLFSYILSSSTLKGKRVMIFNTLFTLLKQSSYILATDADINDMVLCYFDKIKIKYHMIENTYKNIDKTKASEYDDKEVLIQKMEHMLLDDEKIIACFDSKKEMDMVVQRLKKFCEDNELIKQVNNFIVYSSNEGEEDDFLHINDRWKSKNIFYTPKITIGVSFDNKQPRDVFLIALGNSINSFGYVQQICRCRNINELHYYVTKTYQPLKYNNVEDVKVHYTDMLKNYESLYRDNKHVVVDDDLSDHVKLKDLIENNGAVLDYESGEWILHNNVFNDLFFIHEYYDHVLRSAPREQFRWMLIDKGFAITHVIDRLRDAENDTIREKNKVCKERIELNQDQINKRALYNKESSLTECEKKILENAKRRAKFLKIDFSKKVERKKWEEFLVDDKVFSQHYAFRLLNCTDNNLDIKIAKQMEKDYNVLNCKSILTKIKLIKQLEGILIIDTLDIDTTRDIEHFDENVAVSDELKDLIKNIFRIRKNDIKVNDKYENWYYQLINMYKNVIGNVFLVKQGTERKYFYNINSTLLIKHQNLLKNNT